MTQKIKWTSAPIKVSGYYFYGSPKRKTCGIVFFDEGMKMLEDDVHSTEPIALPTIPSPRKKAA